MRISAPIGSLLTRSPTPPTTGASPLLAANLTSSNLVYDSHGDITTIGNEVIGYDESGRHMSTVTSGTSASIVSYQRDATDQVVGMTTSGSATNNVRYSSTGTGMQFTLNSTSTAVNETDVSLPGGVTESIRSTASVWSFPDIHGDDIVTTNATGVRNSTVPAVYDPFGNQIDLTTGLIGTTTANAQDLGNTTTPGATFGWEGSHSKQYQHDGDIATIEMGARQYVPLLGRFLSVDPIPGGNSNDYNYPNDPIGGNDRSGKMSPDSYVAALAYGLKVRPSAIPNGLGYINRGFSLRPMIRTIGGPGTSDYQAPPPIRDTAVCGGFVSGVDCAGDTPHFSGEVNFRACANFCAGVNLSVGSDNSANVVYGYGADYGVSGSLGVAINRSTGLSGGASCQFAPGIGGYGSAGVTQGSSTAYLEGGVAFGGEVGCGVEGSSPLKSWAW